MKQWRDFMAKYMPGGDVTDLSYVFAYAVSTTMLQVLKQCNGDFSRDNVMKQAENLHDFELPVLLPGIKVNIDAHRPSSDHLDAVHEVGRQDLGAVRRSDHRRDGVADNGHGAPCRRDGTDARRRSIARDKSVRPA